MGLFSKRPARDERRSAGPGRQFRTAASSAECRSNLEKMVTWWTPPYPHMPAWTPAGIEWVGDDVGPIANLVFELPDGSPGLMSIWDGSRDRILGLYAPTASDPDGQLDIALAAWRRVDGRSGSDVSTTGDSLRFVAPPVPRDLPNQILIWSGLPETESNYSEASRQLGMQICIKAAQIGLENSRASSPPGTFERVLEETEYLAMGNLHATPFMQRVPWRMATLIAKHSADMVGRGETPSGYHR